MNLNGFEFWLTARGLSKQTVTGLVGKVRHLSSQKALTLGGFQNFVVNNRGRFTNNTINVYVKAIRNWGKYTRSRPLTMVSYAPKNASPRQSLSLDELNRFLAVTVPHSNHSKVNYGLFFYICALSGCRMGELVKLRQKDVSPAEGCLYLTDTKTHDTRKVPLPIEVIAQIEGDPPFPTTPQAYNQAFKYRLNLAGINRPNITPYSLRHTAITLLLQQPHSNLFDIQTLVGHKSANTTAIYYHSCLERIKRVIQSHPILNKDLSPLDRARIITDTIRAMGIDLNPTIKILKDRSVEMKLNIPNLHV